MEGVATASEETSDTEVAVTTTDDSDAVLALKLLEYGTPAASGQDGSQLGVGVVGDADKVQAQVDLHSAVDIVTTGPVAVATAADGEFGLGGLLQSLQDKRNLVCILGGDNAGGGQAGRGGPQGVDAVLVRGAVGPEDGVLEACS